MILRQRLPGGINRDVDLGPSSGIRWNAPIGGGLVEPAPPKVYERGKTEERREYQRAYKQARRQGTCARLMPKSGALCGRMAGHQDHCKTRYAMDNEQSARTR